MVSNELAEALDRFQVGDTPLLEVGASDFGLESVLVKDESQNQFGTFKDRKSREVALYADHAGARIVLAMTSGNYGYSLPRFLELAGIRSLLFVSDNLDPVIVNKLREKARVTHEDLEKKELDLDSRASGSSVQINATNFFDDAYLGIFREIKMGLRKQNKNPDYVVVPLGSGELFAAALRYYYLSGTKVIGVTTDFRGTAAKMLYAKYRPIMKKIMQHANRDKFHVINATEPEIKQAYEWAQRKKISAEPSAAAAFVALQRHNFRPGEEVVFVNTGDGRKNFYSQP